MVLTFIAGFAATFGAAEGIRAAQSKSRREEHRTRKNNLVVRCARGSKYSNLLEGRRVVLARGKLYVDTGTEYTVPFGHPFTGYFLPYPSPPHPGLVSTTTPAAPIMNWIYLHATTHELRYGPRAASEGNVTGPWDCTRQDRRLVLEGWEGFCAVKEGDFWALYFDREGDGLKGKVESGTPVVELELVRTEMRVQKPVLEPVEKPVGEKGAGGEGEDAGMEKLKAQAELIREALWRIQAQAGEQEKAAREDGPAGRKAAEKAATLRSQETVLRDALREMEASTGT